MRASKLHPNPERAIRSGWLRASLLSSLVLAGCSSEESGPANPPGGGQGGGGAGGAIAKGGSAPAAGTAATAGMGGTATPSAGSGSAPAGASSGGAGGVTPSSGGASASGTAGMQATAGAPSGAGSGDSYVSDVQIAVHEEVATILVVSWTQAQAADECWLEFTFEAGNVMKSPAKPGMTGAHREMVLGVPASTAVAVRIVSKAGGVEHQTRDHMGTTGPLPAGLPVPTVMDFDASKASPERFLFGAVENSKGGCGSSCYNRWIYWTYIMDRKGRMVWYYADPTSNATSSFQRIARDGEYIWIEKRPYGRPGDRSVLKMTLDWQYFEEIPIANLADAIDVTTDGSLLYDAEDELRERTREGATRTIFDCRTHFGQGFACYTNTINWNEASDTVLMSYPDENTVIEVNRANGMVVATYGDHDDSYAFSPATWQFEFQHFPNITEDGTLLISSHMPGFSDTYMPVAGEHAFIEFTIDRDDRRLVEKWVYHEGMEWAMYKGMAIRLSNGNTLANYGSGGVIREITPAKDTVFYVKFDADTGDDFYNKMVGHNVLIDDLYALNGGGPR
jgi:hypothetical protein